MNLFKPKKNQHFLLLGISGLTVKALIFKLPASDKEKIHIIGASLKYIDRYGKFNNGNFEKDAVKKAIFDATEEANIQAKINTKKLPALLLLSADILKARVVSQSFLRKNPKEKISAKEEKEIINEILKGAEKEITHLYAQETGILPEEIHFTNLDFLNIKVDGYSAQKLQGLNGRLINFKIVAVFLPKRYFQDLQKINKDLKIEVSQIIHGVQLLRFFPNIKESNAVFLHIERLFTQVFLVKNGKLEITGEFSFGEESFIQALSNTLGLSIERARLLKNKYVRNLLSESSKRGIRKIFLPVAIEWFENLKLKLSETEASTPPNIYIFGKGSLLPEIGEILNKGDWGEFFSNYLFQVEFMNAKLLKSIKDETGSLDELGDAFSLLSCYFPSGNDKI